MRLKALLLLFVNFSLLYGQSEFWDEIIIDPSLIPPEFKAGYIYDPSGPVKTIRVNVHFMLRDDGTGNFTETSDVYTTTGYDGYDYANDLIRYCNDMSSYNSVLNHQPIPSVPALKKNFQFQLCGVFFHRNTADYEASTGTAGFSKYVENDGEAINIFLNKCGSCLGGGAAILYGDRLGYQGHLEYYKRSLDEGNIWANIVIANGVVHELCHNFGLVHPLRQGGGACCDGVTSSYCDDGCSDTPTWQELKSRGFSDPCCYNCPSGSNNLMDYSGFQHALSPEQLTKVHEVFDNSKKPYQSCSYDSDMAFIFNSNENASYVAKRVSIYNGVDVVVDNNQALFISAEEFVIDGTLEIRPGSVLYVNSTPECD